MIVRVVGVALVTLAIAGCGSGTDAGVPGAARPSSAPDAEPAAAARSAPFAIVPDAPSGAVRLEVAPGARRVLRLRLANGADVPRTFALRATLPWIRVAPAVTVPARQSIAVTARVAVPAGAASGRRDARVLARAPAPDAAPLTVEYVSAVRVRVEVVSS